MDDMVEGCLAALAVLSRDYETRVMIRQLNLVPLITQLLYSESEYLQRAAASLLYELTSDTDGSLAIEQEGASARLTELLHSRNEAVGELANIFSFNYIFSLCFFLRLISFLISFLQPFLSSISSHICSGSTLPPGR